MILHGLHIDVQGLVESSLAGKEIDILKDSKSCRHITGGKHVYISRYILFVTYLLLSGIPEG